MTERPRGARLVRQLTRLVLAPEGDPGLSAAEWRALLGLAVRERCGALAWVRAGSVIARFAPAETAESWRRLYIAIAVRGHAQIVAAAEGAAALHPLGIHPITLKGFPLAAALYGDAVARACVDIDWFIPAEARADARGVLTSQGWIHNGSGPPWDESYERPGPHGTTHLEIHSSLLHPRFAYLPVPEPEYEPMLVEGVAVRRHCGPLLAPYLAAHLAQHAAAPLLWDIDFATLWGRMAAGEQVAVRRAARRAGLERYLAWAERRAGYVLRMAEGKPGAERRLGFVAEGRHDVHPAWRHVWLAPSLSAALQAADGWLRPSWVRDAYGPGVRGVVRRVVRHWRTALTINHRIGDRAPGDGAGVPTAVARLDGSRLLELARGVVREGGDMWIVATGSSMLPTIASGDHVRLGPVMPLRVGDIVLARVNGAPVLHRVARMWGDQVVLRGDACQADDRPITASDVVASVRAVSRGAALRDPAPPPRRLAKGAGMGPR